MNQTLSKNLAKVVFPNNIEKRLLIEQYKDKVFDGNLLAQKIRSVLKNRILTQSQKIQKNTNGIISKPCLGYIIVGDLPQSELYVKLKLKACDEVGIDHKGFNLPSSISEESLIKKVKEL